MNWDEAKGCMVKSNGKWFIDFTSSIFCQNFGHNNPYVVREVKEQLKKCNHPYGYDTEIKNKFVEKLRKMIRYEHILLFSTGAEAIEASLKIAINGGYECIGFERAMHGRTLGAEALVGKRKLPNIETWTDLYNDNSIHKKAFYIEGYRGYDCKVLDEKQIRILKNHQQEKGNIIIFDEIQSGFYRTSSLFIYQYYNIRPDILVIGKSIGGGFPLSAVCFNKPLDLLELELTSTHSGQPLQMAAGYGVLKFIEEKFDKKRHSENINIMNKFWHSLKTEHNNLGMVGAFRCESEDLIYQLLLNEGLLVTKTHKGWIKIAPPIVIDSRLLKKGLDIVKKYVN